jgi:hypothetical protein
VPKPFPLGAIVATSDGKTFLCCSIDCTSGPPGPGWWQTWTPDADHNPKTEGRGGVIKNPVARSADRRRNPFSQGHETPLKT